MKTLLDELESVDKALAGADPAELTTLAPLLERRGQLVSSIVPAPAFGDCFERSLMSGEQLRARLQLTAAGIREQLTELYHYNYLLRAIQPARPEPTEIDCCG